MNAHAAKPDIRDVVGCTHTAGQYNFTDKDYLNEGADDLLKLGTRVIKLFLTPTPAKMYPFNSKWPTPKSMVDVVDTPYFKDVFAKPFSTFISGRLPARWYIRTADWIRIGQLPDSVLLQRQGCCRIGTWHCERRQGSGRRNRAGSGPKSQV